MHREVRHRKFTGQRHGLPAMGCSEYGTEPLSGHRGTSTHEDSRNALTPKTVCYQGLGLLAQVRAGGKGSGLMIRGRWFRVRPAHACDLLVRDQDLFLRWLERMVEVDAIRLYELSLGTLVHLGEARSW
jgi:hypothetical protein